MTDDLDLMSRRALREPDWVARTLLAGPRCRRYEGFDPPFFIVSRYADVVAVLRDPERFSSGQGQGPNIAPPAGLVSDPPQHTYFRQLVQQEFLPRSIGRLRPRLQEIARELLDAVAGRPVWDLHDDLAFPLPVTIICEIFGIPTEDIGQFKRWSDASVAALSAKNPQIYAEELARMQHYVLNRLHSERNNPRGDRLLARIAQARRDGVPISDEEAVALVLQLFVAGNETTTSLITNFVWRLLERPGLWAAFCEHRFDLMRAINESLRFDPPLLGLFRTTACDVEIGGTRVPAGAKVLTHYGAANRDPAVFQRPDEFDVQRTGRKLLSFGLGIHVCLGAELARLEAEVALDALRARCHGLSLVDDGERIGPFLFWGRSKLPVRG